MHSLNPMPGASAYAERAEVSKIIKNIRWHELLPKSWRKSGASFQIMSYDILDFSWEKLVAFESHLAVQQPSELRLVEVSLKYLSSTLLSPLSSWTGLNHAAMAGIKQRVLMAKSPTFWFCISLNQALRAGDIHQVHHGVISKVTVIFHRLDSFYWLLQLATMFCHSFWMEEVAKTLWSFDETSAKNQVSTTKIHHSGGRDSQSTIEICWPTWAESKLEYLLVFLMEMDVCPWSAEMEKSFLQISQSIESAEVLLHYQELLGGGICKDSSSSGKRKAVLKRQVCGSKMRHVAALLGQILWMKQAQLKMAAGGNIEGPCRERIGEQLLQLKQ